MKKFALLLWQWGFHSKKSKVWNQSLSKWVVMKKFNWQTGKQSFFFFPTQKTHMASILDNTASFFIFWWKLSFFPEIKTEYLGILHFHKIGWYGFHKHDGKISGHFSNNFKRYMHLNSIFQRNKRKWCISFVAVYIN